MSRLGSRMNLGFYPTPQEELDKIFKKIEVEGQISILDPCFGDARALKGFKEKFNVVTYGVELHKERFNENKDIIDIAINGDALDGVGINKGCIDLLFLNPPYDNDFIASGYEIKQRLETRFLNKYSEILVDGGILIYVAPSLSISKDLDFLLNRYKLIGLYPVVNEDDGYNVSSWKQFVFIGRKKINRVNTAYKSAIQKILVEKQSFLEPIKIKIQHQEKIDKTIIKIFPIGVSPEKMLEHSKDAFFTAFQAELLEKMVIKNLQPIAEPREGHLALLTASGLMNGDIDENISIKGMVEYQHSESIEEEEDDNGKIFKTTTKVLSVPKVKINMLENSNILREIR